MFDGRPSQGPIVTIQTHLLLCLLFLLGLNGHSETHPLEGNVYLGLQDILLTEVR